MKNPVKIIGYDTQGRFVMGGLFQLADTYGFSLTDSMWFCKAYGLTPGLDDYAKAALEAGWPEDRIEARMKEAFSDTGQHQQWPTARDLLWRWLDIVRRRNVHG